MNPTETLIAYSRGEASMEAVVRALISYEGWLVAVGVGIEVMKTETFSKGLILSTTANIPNDQLWFFTDEKAANNAVAKGGQPGFYVGPIPGTRLFSYLPSLPARENDTVQINIGSPPEETWYFGQDSFALVALWASAITVEAHLNAPDSPEKLAALRDYIGYTYLIFPEQHAIATAQGAGGLSNPAMIFTAPDCTQNVMQWFPQLERQTLDGQALFERLPSQGVDGVVFNPLGPGPQAVFDMAYCNRIASSPDGA